MKNGIDAKIAELGDWRGEMLARIRKIIKQADPEVIEELKWRGVPVWSHAGIICTGETYTECGENDVRPGSFVGRPFRSFQLQPRRQHPARHRFPRGR